MHVRGVRITVFLAWLLLSGCSQQPVILDNSTAKVQPGRGVTNVLELGMTLEQVRDATRDVSTHGIHDRDWIWKRWGASRFALVQSLGAIAPIEENGKLAIISFHVLPYDSDITARGLTVTNRFRGMVADRLSFKDGPIRRQDVELQFGHVSHVISNLSDGIHLAKEGKPFLFRAPGGSETIYYRHKGINFDLKSNEVTGFSVYATAKADAAESK